MFRREACPRGAKRSSEDKALGKKEVFPESLYCFVVVVVFNVCLNLKRRLSV